MLRACRNPDFSGSFLPLLVPQAINSPVAMGSSSYRNPQRQNSGGGGAASPHHGAGIPKGYECCGFFLSPCQVILGVVMEARLEQGNGIPAFWLEDGEWEPWRSEIY